MISDSFVLTGLPLQKTVSLAAAVAGITRKKDVIALSGDLGTGKTVFAKAFIRALTNENEDVPSPTFTLVQIYDALQNGEPAEIWHFDLYRMKTPEEIYETGFEEALSEGISLIEWPERAGNLLPKNKLTVRLEAVAGRPDQRNVTLTADGADWCQRMEKIKKCPNARNF